MWSALKIKFGVKYILSHRLDATIELQTPYEEIVACSQ